MGLLPVPGAAIRGAKTGHDFDQILDIPIIGAVHPTKVNKVRVEPASSCGAAQMYSIFPAMEFDWTPPDPPAVSDPVFTSDPGLFAALALCEGIGPAAFHRLVSFFGSPEAVFAAPQRELTEACPRLGAGALVALSRGPNLAEVARQEEECRRHGVRMVAFRSPGYPAPLLDLAQPPPLLFLKGEWREADRRSVAVVGTRNPSRYGEKAARAFGLRLSEAGWTVVSGLARGIDTLAHEAALQGGSRTLAVLGSGLDRLYPRENQGLSRRIAEEGCLITEFPMGMDPRPDHFPRRNRLISALSYGTLVVEADQDSGALITAEFALEQGREVFAVPGAIMSPGTRGTHRLIKEGAHLAENVEDILDVLEGMSQALPARRVPVRAALAAAGSGDSGPRPGPGARPAASPDAPATADLKDSHRLLLDLLGPEAQTLDGLAERLRALPARKAPPMHRLLADLLQLELLGLVRRMPGAVFRLAQAGEGG